MRQAANLRTGATIANDDREKGEATTAEVIALYEEVIRLDPTVFADWHALAWLYWQDGQLDRAVIAADRSLTLASSEEQRGLSFEIKTHIAERRGDFQQALAFAQQSLAAFHRLAQSHDLAFANAAAVSELLVGDALIWLGEPSSAEVYFGRALATARTLLAQEPTSGAFERTISLALERLGNARLAQQHVSEARAAYVEMLHAAQGLREANPALTSFERDLAVATVHVADMDTLGGDYPPALKGYMAARAIVQRLQLADPSFSTAFDVANVNYRIAGILLAQGDLAGALAHYQALRGFAENILASDPGHVRARVGLVLCLNGLADVALLSNNFDLARSHLSQASGQLAALEANVAASSLVFRVNWLVRVRLSRLPGARVTWRDLAPDYEAVWSAPGVFTAGDLLFIERARTLP